MDHPTVSDAAHARDARPDAVVLYEYTDGSGDTLRVTRQPGSTIAVVRTDCPHAPGERAPHAPGAMLWRDDLIELRDALTEEIERRRSSAPG